MPFLTQSDPSIQFSLGLGLGLGLIELIDCASLNMQEHIMPNDQSTHRLLWWWSLGDYMTGPPQGAKLTKVEEQFRSKAFS